MWGQKEKKKEKKKQPWLFCRFLLFAYHQRSQNQSDRILLSIPVHPCIHPNGEQKMFEYVAKWMKCLSLSHIYLLYER